MHSSVFCVLFEYTAHFESVFSDISNIVLSRRSSFELLPSDYVFQYSLSLEQTSLCWPRNIEAGEDGNIRSSSGRAGLSLLSHFLHLSSSLPPSLLPPSLAPLPQLLPGHDTPQTAAALSSCFIYPFSFTLPPSSTHQPILGIAPLSLPPSTQHWQIGRAHV